MQLRINLSIHNLLVLHHYFRSLYLNHYPIELIHIIIEIYYKLFRVKIACGQSHNLLLFDDKIYSWSNNGDTIKPQEIIFPNKLTILKIACGKFHSMVLTTTGLVYSWGRNNEGQLGQGMFSGCVSKPSLITFDSLVPNERIKKIDCGGYSSMAFTNLGNIYVWGHNFYWELGLDHHENVHTPQKNKSRIRYRKNDHVEKFILGTYYSLLLTTSKKFFDWGYSRSLRNMVYSEINDEIDIKDIVCGDYFAVSISEKNEIYFSRTHQTPDSTKYFPVKINFPNLKKVVCGNNYILILNTNGKVYSRGNNDKGQLGLRHYNSKHKLKKLNLNSIKKIACRHDVSFAINDMNELYIWGYGYGNEPKKFVF